jgi:hypothetical protein
MAYLRENNKCPGCRGSDKGKPLTRRRCRIKTCENLQKVDVEFCFKCEKFPCTDLKHLDDRYRKRYDMSNIENLTYLRDKGMKEFLSAQKKKYNCPECGGTISVHNRKCYECGYNKN